MATRLLVLGVLLGFVTGPAVATVPMSPQPILSFRAVKEDRSQHHTSYALIGRVDTQTINAIDITRKRSSNGLWYQFQASNGFRLDVSLQHIHETLTEPTGQHALNVPEFARFGTGLTGGLGWVLPVVHWGDVDHGWNGSVGLQAGGWGFLSVEGDRFAPFRGNGRIGGYAASGAIGAEVRRSVWYMFHDVNVRWFVEAAPLTYIGTKDLPLVSFEDHVEASSPLGWVRMGIALQFNWSPDNPTPAVMGFNMVLDPVKQQTVSLGIAF